MQRAKIVLLVVATAGIISAVFASRRQPEPCVLYTPNAQGFCVVTWPQPVTLVPGGAFGGFVPVTNDFGHPCVQQNVFNCIKE